MTAWTLRMAAGLTRARRAQEGPSWRWGREAPVMQVHYLEGPFGLLAGDWAMENQPRRDQRY